MVSDETRKTPSALRARLAAALFLAAFLLFWPATRQAFIPFDDDVYVYENDIIRRGLGAGGCRWALTTMAGGNWHPLAWWSHMADVTLFGLDPFGHHLHSVLLHAVNAVLLFWWLSGMTGSLWRSAAVSALFALHPLRVESVAWISERKDVLGALFWMLSTWSYLHYARRPRPWRYLLTLALFGLGMTAKPMLVTLPLVFLLLDFWPLGRAPIPPRIGWGAPARVPLGKLVSEKVPYLFLSAAGSILAYLAQRRAETMASGSFYPVPARFLNALTAYADYLGKMLWPVSLAVYYPLRQIWPPWWRVALAGALILAVSLLAARTISRRPFVAVGWCWFLGTLFPVIGLVKVGSQTLADRYTYLPSIGPAVALIWFAVEKAGLKRITRGALTAVAAALLAVLFGAARHQLAYWSDGETLFRHALSVTGDNWAMHNNLGLVLLRAGRVDEALGHFQAASRAAPENGMVANNLGEALARGGRTAEAIEAFRKATAIDPGRERPRTNLANILAARASLDGEPAEVADVYRGILRRQPDSAETHNNLGVVLAAMGDEDGAIRHYREAVRLKPDYADAHYNLANALLARGRLDEAIDGYREAACLKPRWADAFNNLGIALARKGEWREAASVLKEAIGWSPGEEKLHRNLGLVFLGRGRYPEAADEFGQALGFNPGSAENHNNYGRALSGLGRNDEAAVHFSEAARLRKTMQ